MPYLQRITRRPSRISTRWLSTPLSDSTRELKDEIPLLLASVWDEVLPYQVTLSARIYPPDLTIGLTSS